MSHLLELDIWSSVVWTAVFSFPAMSLYLSLLPVLLSSSSLFSVFSSLFLHTTSSYLITAPEFKIWIWKYQVSVLLQYAAQSSCSHLYANTLRKVQIRRYCSSQCKQLILKPGVFRRRCKHIATWHTLDTLNVCTNFNIYPSDTCYLSLDQNGGATDRQTSWHCCCYINGFWYFSHKV